MSSSSGRGENYLVVNQRQRERSRSRDSTHRAAQRRRRRTGASSSPCRCAHCGPWQQDHYRDLSIRYPGMTQQSYDEMVNLLDEVMNEINEDDGLVLSSIEVSFEPFVLVAGSPTEIQPTELSSPPEIRNNEIIGRIDAIGSDGSPLQERDGLPSRFPVEVDVKGDHCYVEPMAR